MYEVWTSSVSDRASVQILPSGETVTLVYEWRDGGNEHYFAFGFKLRNNVYGTEKGDDASLHPERYKPERRVKDGETVTVNIYDDRWEW